jgi:6,7-dimethyl-8-ribityllumazine synthase
MTVTLFFGERNVQKTVLLIVSTFYRDIADELVRGAVAELDAQGLTYEIVEMPGALEIPVAMSIAINAKPKYYAGCVALGCVIRGETSHYDIVASESARALLEIATASGLPLGNGVLTVDSREQAIVRADTRGKNKGGDAARACLALLKLKNSTE